MKGLILTLDAMVAVAFLLTAIVILSSMMFQPLVARGAYLKQITLDALTLIEKEDTLDDAVTGDSTSLRRVLEMTPPQVCMHIYIIDKNGGLIALIPKNDCGETGKEMQIAARHFIHDGEPYTLKAESWQRRDIG